MAATHFRDDREEVPLPEILSEFRIALYEEIDTARRNSASNAVPLVNGRRIGRVAASCQYVFQIENSLNSPGDAPGDLHVPGLSPIRVTILAVEGQTVTLSVPTDLGDFVPHARLQTDLTFLMQKLVERIEALADARNLVGDRILGLAGVTGTPAKTDTAGLNDEQAAAVASSLSRDTTFIWGPPGTGKTKTIGAIGDRLFRLGRSLLLVSHTNVAVDQALWHIGSRLSAEEIASGKVLRVGEPKDRRLLERPDLLLETHVERRTKELTSEKSRLFEEQTDLGRELSEIEQTIETHAWIAEAPADIAAMSAERDAITALEGEVRHLEAERNRLDLLTRWWKKAEDEAHRVSLRVVQLQKAAAVASELEERRHSLEQKVARRDTLLSESEAVLRETTAVGVLRRLWRGLPAPEQQETIVTERRRERDRCRDAFDKCRTELDTIVAEQRRREDALAAFRKEYGGDPPSVLQRAEQHEKQIEGVRRRADALRSEAANRRRALDALLRSRLAVLRERGLTDNQPSSAKEMLTSVEAAFKAATLQFAGIDINGLRRRLDELRDRLRRTSSRIEEIDAALKVVEDQIISEASVVATTLTRAYLRESINKRRFDTVILDEASMAPIPALWVAASLADTNGVVVGDFKQLPPIVLSEHKLAEKWLGTDIFTASGVSMSRPSHFVGLRQQYRMHPEISVISNSLIYDEELTDDPATADDGELSNWYDAEWGHDRPVLLVDTGPLDAWVTSVSRGSRSSRLNILSATICVDIAGRIMRSDASKASPESHPRVLIVCPYRPHAQLLELLICDQGLDGVGVVAGTAHNFQGTEADAVIFDLVNDEPHWKVGMFMARGDDNTTRLLNVALTRAKRRLVIVGDFDYIERKGKKAFLGGTFIPFLRERYHRVSALDAVPNGFASRASHAQTLVFGGEVEADTTRTVVTQDRFFELLSTDLSQASFRAVFYSPFLTESRVGLLQPHLRAAVERGVRVYVVTKPNEDRSAAERAGYYDLERSLVLQLYFPSRAASGFVMAGFGEGLVAATPERAGQRSFCRVECANDEAHEQSAYLRHRQRDQCCAPFFPTECFRLRSAFARITASIA